MYLTKREQKELARQSVDRVKAAAITLFAIIGFAVICVVLVLVYA